MMDERQSYDAAYKKLFGTREVAASLVEAFMPREILARMDLESLEPLPTEHVANDNRERRNDLLWKIAYGGRDCYLVIMLEFQSAEDWFMSLRVSAYSALLLQDMVRHGNLGKKDRLPVIFPFVIYNGNKKWEAPLDVTNLLVEHDESIKRYQLKQEYYLLDIKHLPENRVLADKDSVSGNLSLAVFNLENAESIREVTRILKNLAGILPENDKLFIHEAFINLLACGGRGIKALNKDIMINNCKTVQEAYAMLAEEEIGPRWAVNIRRQFAEGREQGREEGRLEGRLEGRQEGREEGRLEGRLEGRQEGREEGRLEGRQEGRSSGMKKLIIDTLTSKFGQLPDDLVAKIEGIPKTDDLEKLGIKALCAPSLGEVKEIFA